MKAWYVIDDRTEYGAICTEEKLNAATQAEAVAEAWKEWNRMTQFDRDTTTDYFVAYAEEEDGGLDWDSMTDIVTIKGLDPESWGLETEGNRVIDDSKWYAVLKDDDDNDWGYGSYDLETAKDMAKGLGEDAYIAVIEMGNDPICIEEIREF